MKPWKTCGQKNRASDLISIRETAVDSELATDSRQAELPVWLVIFPGRALGLSACRYDSCRTYVDRGDTGRPCREPASHRRSCV